MQNTAEQNKPGLKPVTHEMLELFEKPTIASQLPIVFDNGHTLARFEGWCTICHAPLEASEIHGEISHPFPKVAIIQAVGGCRACNIYVPLFMRYKDDGRTETRDADGNWVFGHAVRDREQKTRGTAETVWALALAVAILGALSALVTR